MQEIHPKLKRTGCSNNLTPISIQMTNWIERLPQKSAFKIQYDFSGIIIQYEPAKSKVFDTIYIWKFSRRRIRLSTSRSWARHGLNQLWRTNTSITFQGPIFERCNNPMRNCRRIKQNAACESDGSRSGQRVVAVRDAAPIITHKRWNKWKEVLRLTEEQAWQREEPPSCVPEHLF